MIADILLTFGVISIIGIQALMISIYHERFNKINRQLAVLMKHKAEKRELKSEYKIIQGEMDMTHRGQMARVQATFYPKKMV
tara:strand:- start:406 stop:651 length:246 start_codon:yes stop_codon:yes gene_type:complete